MNKPPITSIDLICVYEPNVVVYYQVGQSVLGKASRKVSHISNQTLNNADYFMVYYEGTEDCTEINARFVATIEYKVIRD